MREQPAATPEVLQPQVFLMHFGTYFTLTFVAKKCIFSFQVIQLQGWSRRWLYHSSKAYVGQTGRMSWHVTRYEFYIQNYPLL